MGWFGGHREGSLGIVGGCRSRVRVARLGEKKIACVRTLVELYMVRRSLIVFLGNSQGRRNPSQSEFQRDGLNAGSPRKS